MASTSVSPTRCIVNVLSGADLKVLRGFRVSRDVSCRWMGQVPNPKALRQACCSSPHPLGSVPPVTRGACHTIRRPLLAPLPECYYRGFMFGFGRFLFSSLKLCGLFRRHLLCASKHGSSQPGFRQQRRYAFIRHWFTQSSFALRRPKLQSC